MSLARITRSLPFLQTNKGNLTSRNAGGHAGWPTWMINPQYNIVIPTALNDREKQLDIILTAKKDIAWNVKLLLGNGNLVTEYAKV